MLLITKRELLKTIENEVFANINRSIENEFSSGNKNTTVYFQTGHIDMYIKAKRLLEENGFFVEIYCAIGSSQKDKLFISWVDE